MAKPGPLARSHTHPLSQAELRSSGSVTHHAPGISYLSPYGTGLPALRVPLQYFNGEMHLENSPFANSCQPCPFLLSGTWAGATAGSCGWCWESGRWLLSAASRAGSSQVLVTKGNGENRNKSMCVFSSLFCLFT